MNQIVTVQPKKMLLATMAEKYLLREEEFAKTVRATCGLSQATPEQFAAFLMVANTYGLNPLTREIYAFPGRNGGIVPIVSIDGWVNLVNSKPNCDGFEFEMEHDDQGKLVSCTCKMYRKDRTYPVTVTEYLDECRRPTDPWKMAHRMLRHKAMIQAARYAFGFAGIFDEDEGRTIAEAVDVTPKVRVPSPSEVEEKTEASPETAVKDDPISTGPMPQPAGKKYLLPKIENDYEAWFNAVGLKFAEITDAGELETFWNTEIEKYRGTQTLFPMDYDDLLAAYDKRQAVLNSDE